MSALRYLFSFKGRINRAKMWLFLLISMVTGGLVSFIDPAAVGDLHGFSLVPVISKDNPAILAVMTGIVIVINLLLLWATFALSVKRLHDRDMGAIWLLVFFAIPLICVGVIAAVVGIEVIQQHQTFVFQNWMTAPLAISGLILLVIFIWSFVLFYCLRGSDGANRFGDDPLAKGPAFCDPEKPVDGCIPKP